MRVRFSADTNHHYFINMFVISTNFHCLQLFIAISPLYNAWVLRPQLPIKQWRTGSDWSVCTYCKMNKLLKNGGGAIGPSWRINWWVLRVWVGSLVSGRRDSQLYCRFPHGMLSVKQNDAMTMAPRGLPKVLCDFGHILHPATVLLTMVK